MFVELAVEEYMLLLSVLLLPFVLLVEVRDFELPPVTVDLMPATRRAPVRWPSMLGCCTQATVYCTRSKPVLIIANDFTLQGGTP